ncbi:hypothetical protein F975_01908 [Acinetobacter sp. ANC 3789]|uniref:hypothetical protein n=1 Tax=Acinetobacter sp. ANC 3789 TaxID=1217714 RepID=UPI0002CE4039|nr:hypothetical protein [Acinetobacter sp. ANC 3789]ENU80154.1 hypothetical protein F975_01908 [Acinetobacter sp. ANC 3789]
MELKIDELTREELEDYCKVLRAEYSELNNENQILSRAILDAVELARQNREIAESYQNIFGQLFGVIKNQYDAEFKIQDLPKLFS